MMNWKKNMLFAMIVATTVATHVFASVEIESVVCNPNTGRLAVKYKNQSTEIREGILYVEIYDKDTGKWVEKAQQYIDMLGKEEKTTEISGPSGAVVRRARIVTHGGGGTDPESDTCEDTGDPRWSYVWYDIPTLTQWGLIIMAGLLLTVGAVAIRRRLRTVPA